MSSYHVACALLSVAQQDVSVCQACQHPCLLETGCSLLFLQNKGTRHPDGGQRVFGGAWGRQAGLQERLPPRVSWAALSVSCALLF